MQAELIRFDVENDEHPRNAEGFCIPCEPGEVGELIGRLPTKEGEIRGRFEGYTSKAATEAKILRDVFESGDAYFRTGDLLKNDDEGFYYFIDRIGDTFRWKGENVSTQEVAEALGTFPGVQMTNVYGVEIPDQDGRAGMASIVLDDPASFDGAAYYAHAIEALPSYACPAFVRVQPELEITGTFKLRKVDLQKEGFDPETCPDPLFVRNDAARAYTPLNAERHAAILAGELRL